jgi:outer membrane protein assembly factor BamB
MPDAKEVEELKQQLIEIDRRRDEYAGQYPQERRGGAGNAAATPVCDGRNLYVTFGTGIVAAFDLYGKQLWIRQIEGPTLGFGHSASPVLAGAQLIVHFRDLVALDPASGKEVWRRELPAKHGSPVVARIAEHEVLITPSGALVQAADGRVIAEKLFNLSENSPLVHDGVLYAHESGKIKAYKLPESVAEGTEVELLWESSGSREQRMASAAWHEGLLYAGSRSGILDVTDARTGKVLHRKRLELGELFPSPTVAGDLVFISGRDGKTLVLRAGPELEEVALNELDRFSSTPIFIGSRMYLRTEKTLYCILDGGI